MVFEKKKIKEKGLPLEDLKNEFAHPVSTVEECLSFLIGFFEIIRPHKKQDWKVAENNLSVTISFIEQNPWLALKLQHAITRQLDNAALKPAFTKSGIPLGGDFWQELNNRFKHKIIAPEQDRQDFLYVLNRIFYKKDDYLWVSAIKRSTWISFFELLQFTLRATDHVMLQHMMDATTVLSYQVASAGLDKEITGFITAFGGEDENPFIIQNRLLLELQQQLKTFPGDTKEQANRVKLALHEIENEIAFITKNKAEKGTSIRQSYKLLLLNTRIRRMLILLDAMDNDEHFDMGGFVDMFQTLVRNENRKYSIREFLSQAFSYLAYQIAEHTGEKGGKYITSTRKDYFNMIISAGWGGLIICFVAVFKNLLGRLHFAHFWQGFWYSTNYSLGFVAIDQTGSTLATKQPAFTANAVAVSLDSKKNTGVPDLNNLVITVARVVRSQTASFIGNLLVVFPGTFLLAWVYDLIFHHKIAEGRAALQLLQDQHPFQSFSLLYACNTGVFLFLSGIIAGYVQNKIRYARIAERVAKSTRGNHVKNKSRLAHFIEKNAGAYAGNISLGFFLGMAGPLGKIFGIPFDIRHITISSGNMAIGVYGLGIHNIPLNYLITVFLGVLGVGFFNFLISFSLAFFVAVKSRGIKLKHYPELLGILGRHFRRRPLSFIFPPKIAG